MPPIPELTLEEANTPKCDLASGQAGPQAGTLLDVGWGFPAMKAPSSGFDVSDVGYCEETEMLAFDRHQPLSIKRCCCKAGRISPAVSIEAFEHFGHGSYDDFFKHCFNIMPATGMTVRNGVGLPLRDGGPLTKLSFRGRRVSSVHRLNISGDAPRPPGRWSNTARRPVSPSQALVAPALHQERCRIWDAAVQYGTGHLKEVYNRHYLRGCEHYFTDEMLDCSLVTYLKPGAAA